MVWAAVIAAIIGWVCCGYCAFRWVSVRDENSTILREATGAMATQDEKCEQWKERSEKIQARYDALVEKLRVQAAKPDDGIIHAKNSGDVRRLFEQQVNAEQMKREKSQEN
jgi:hypothetical protein